MTVIARFNAAIFRSLTVTACIAAAVVGGVPTPASGAEPAPAAAGPVDEAAARAAARSSGRPVEITAKRGERETFYANPSGTLSMVQSTEAVRTRRDGEWVPVDPTFVRRADGTVAPVAITVDVELSGGGTTAFARVGAPDKSLTLHWPSALPAPVLDGATATYPEVLPGVDLVATATPSSFREVLVVKDRAAALNPALRRIVFGVTTNGVTLTSAEGGGLALLDANALAVLASPEPVMWDSSGSALAAGNGPRNAGPRDGDRMGRIRAEVAGGRLSLTPDAAMLADPSVTYPLYLDPTFDLMTRTHWTMVDESFPTTEYWKFTGDQGVGYQNFSGVSKKRQYHAFTTTDFSHDQIRTAYFKAFETHAASCNPTAVEAWVTPGVTSATNWSNQPSTWTTKADTQTVAYGRDGCAPNGDWVEFNVEDELQTIANAGGSSVTIGLKAWSESNSGYWKRFDYATELHVEWDQAPNVPTGMKLTDPSVPCVYGSVGRPWINDPNPEVSATLTDPDGDQLKAEYEWGLIGSTRYAYLGSTQKASGSVFSGEFPNTGSLSSGGSYSVRMRGRDYDAIEGALYGEYADRCDFYTDFNVPDAVEVTSTAFPRDARTTKGVGDSGTFTLSPALETDILKYEWAFNSLTFGAPVNASALGADYTINYTVNTTGRNWLHARSIDRAGNKSPITTYEFFVAGSQRNAHWRLDDDPARTATDSEGSRVADLSTNAAWGGGHDSWITGDRALVLDGSSYAETTSSPILTNGRFSIGLRVYLDKTAGTTGEYVALSRSGANTSAVKIGYRSKVVGAVTSYVWFFEMAASDSSTAARTVVELPATTQTWTHLTAIYTREHIRLHTATGVPGIGESWVFDDAATSYTAGWASTGAFRMGGAMSGGSWVGSLDDVVTFPAAIDEADVTTLATETA